MVGLEFCWRDHAELAMEPAAVEPVNVLQGGVLDILKTGPRTTVADQLGLIESVEGLCQGIVIAVSL
jgi:hypothetical protein